MPLDPRGRAGPARDHPGDRSCGYELLAAALSQLGPWQGQKLDVDRDWCVKQLRSKIEATDWPQAREDVRRFLKPGELPSLELWGKEFFLAQAEKLG